MNGSKGGCSPTQKEVPGSFRRTGGCEFVLVNSWKLPCLCMFVLQCHGLHPLNVTTWLNASCARGKIRFAQSNNQQDKDCGTGISRTLKALCSAHYLVVLKGNLNTWLLSRWVQSSGYVCKWAFKLSTKRRRGLFFSIDAISWAHICCGFNEIGEMRLKDGEEKQLQSWDSYRCHDCPPSLFNIEALPIKLFFQSHFPSAVVKTTLLKTVSRPESIKIETRARRLRFEVAKH